MLEFLTKFEFLNKIFKRGESRSSAKERLQLVLIHDRASITPKIMESLKEDLISVISRYLEIDVSELEIGLEQKEGSIALAANIPIKKVRHTPVFLDHPAGEPGATARAEDRIAPSADVESAPTVEAVIQTQSIRITESEAADSVTADVVLIPRQERRKASSRSKRRSKMKRLSEVKKRETQADQEKKGEQF